MQTADNPVTALEERLRALPARIRVVASEAVRQGAATTLIAAQLEFGVVVKVQVVQQAFPSAPDDKHYIDDLFKRIEPAANVILAKVNVDEILHDRLDH